MSIIEENIQIKVHIDPQIFTEIQEEAQVVVHCSFYNDPSIYIGEVGVRVWKETFIVSEQDSTINQLVKAFGIVYQPDWYFIQPGDTKRFTMVFDGLPKSCVSFTLLEIINQPGAFVVKGIKRNNSDIYHVRLD